MSLLHAGFGIPGTHEEYRWGDWERAKQENRVFGLDGYTEIDGGRAKRPFAVPIWIHNNYASAANLLTALDNLDDHAGTQGDLVETDALQTTYEDVLFERFDREQGPIRSPVDLGWFMVGTLHFVHMAPG
jgi:hypothetical protein